MSDFVWNFRGYTPTTGGQAAADSASHANVGAALAGNRAGYVPPSAPVAAAPEQPGVRADEYRAQKQQRLAELKAQLADIDNKIATLSGTDQEVAARLASIGNLGVYQQLLSQDAARQQTAKAASQGIENMLYEAEKLTWGLDAKSDEDRRMVRANIDATLRRVEDQAARSGIDIKKNPAYMRLVEATDNADKAALVRESERKKANEWWSKARNNELVNADIAEIEDFIERNPDSDTASQLRPLVEQYKPKTKESKATYAKRKSDAFALWNSLRWLGADEQTRRISGLTRTERKLLEDFHPDILK